MFLSVNRLKIDRHFRIATTIARLNTIDWLTIAKVDCLLMFIYSFWSFTPFRKIVGDLSYCDKSPTIFFNTRRYVSNVQKCA